MARFNPQGGLEVSSTISATGTTATAPAVVFSHSGVVDSTSGIYSNAAGNIRFSTGGVFRAALNSSGFGLGVTSPSYMLDVEPIGSLAFRVKGSTTGKDVNCLIENTGTDATDDALLSVTTPGGAGDPMLRLAIAGNETWSIGIDNSDGDKLKISQSSTLHTDTRVTLQGNKVGIGTTTPAKTLDVTGAVSYTHLTLPTILRV